MINSVCGIGSTGRICTDIARRLEADGHDCLIAYGRGTVPEQYQRYAIKIGNKLDVCLHGVQARIFDNAGFGSKHATKMLIRKIEEYNPDVIHLHNLHGYYINIEILFAYLKKASKPVIWTLHDCWPFTGHCVHFDAAKCFRWLSGCGDCPQLRTYPKTYGLDRTKTWYQRKKECFSGVADLTIIVPSEWLAHRVKQSFLKEYPLEISHNQIDANIFKPTDSDFREQYGLEGKFVILGVANVWNKTKGLSDFCELRKKLDDKFAIVLVGITEKERIKLPPGIITLPRTANSKKLAEIYSASDVFVNPTHQDTYPTVNLEARACGIPVITYDVGGSPESAGGKYIVRENNIDGLVDQIYIISTTKIS